MNTESTMETLIKRLTRIEKELDITEEPERSIPPHGVPVYAGVNKLPRISTGETTDDGRLICYEGHKTKYSWEVWELATGISSPVVRHKHKGGDPCPIKDWHDFVRWKEGMIAAGDNASLFRWDFDCEYVILSGE